MTVDVGHGGQADESFLLSAANAAPAETVNAPSTVPAGMAIALSLTAASDQSATDTTVGFSYAFDRGDGSGYGALAADSSVSCATTAAFHRGWSDLATIASGTSVRAVARHSAFSDLDDLGSVLNRRLEARAAEAEPS